jgi:hypothetical protein
MGPKSSVAARQQQWHRRLIRWDRVRRFRSFHGGKWRTIGTSARSRSRADRSQSSWSSHDPHVSALTVFSSVMPLPTVRSLRGPTCNRAAPVRRDMSAPSSVDPGARARGASRRTLPQLVNAACAGAISRGPQERTPFSVRGHGRYVGVGSWLRTVPSVNGDLSESRRPTCLFGAVGLRLNTLLERRSMVVKKHGCAEHRESARDRGADAGMVVRARDEHGTST